MPTRRERLLAFMQLKSQRQMLIAATLFLAIVVAILALSLWQTNEERAVVRLGQGIASVDARPLAAFSAVTSRSAQPIPRPSESPMPSGEASFYGQELAGNPTANGEIFDPARLTAAHRTLPMGSRVRVTNVRNDESVVVRINDRGPYYGNRVIDLSTAAARTIGLIRSGTGQVRMALLID